MTCGTQPAYIRLPTVAEDLPANQILHLQALHQWRCLLKVDTSRSSVLSNAAPSRAFAAYPRFAAVFYGLLTTEGPAW